MPAIITQSLQDALNLSAGTIANCVKLTRVDGTVMGYTTYDQDLTIDGVVYKHAPGMNSTQEAQSNDMAVDNLEIQAVFTSGQVRKIDVLAGVYDFCQFEKFIVDYSNPSGGKLIRVTGHIGEIKQRSDGIFSAQLLSSNDAVNQNPLESTAPMCRSLFGDPLRCKKNLAGNDTFGDPITVTGTITDIPGSVITRANVVFQNQSGGGSGGTGMFLRSLAGTAFGSCGATSVATATAGDCSAEWKLPDNQHSGCAGLSTNSTVTNSTGITFGVLWFGNSFSPKFAQLYIVVNGVQLNKIGNYVAGVKLRIAIEATALRVYQNDALLYTFPTAIAPSYPLYYAVALGAQGAQITNAVLISSSGGTGLTLTDSGRTEAFRTFPEALNDPTVRTYRQFAGGKITFTSGTNNGLTYQIKDWDPTNKNFILMRPLGYPCSIGDTYVAVKGCDKLMSTCRVVYLNAANFRGEKELSGPERVLSRP